MLQKLTTIIAVKYLSLLSWLDKKKYCLDNEAYGLRTFTDCGQGRIQWVIFGVDSLPPQKVESYTSYGRRILMESPCSVLGPTPNVSFVRAPVFGDPVLDPTLWLCSNRSMRILLIKGSSLINDSKGFWKFYQMIIFFLN